MKLVLILLFIATCLVKSNSALQYGRQFTKNFNFADASRWQDGRLPCSGDDIEFSFDQFVSIYVDSSASISNLYLPMNGEVKFGDNAVWGVSPDLSTCKGNGRTAKFISDPDQWFNSKNWEAHQLADGIPVHVKNFLDTENVPCDYDQVLFPDDATFTINIPNDITLNRFTIAGQRYDTESLAEYRNSGNGKYQLLGSGVINVSPSTCQDQTGCYCRNSPSYQEIADQICSKTPCAEPSCNKPLLPSGQCCGVCGAVITMSYSTTKYKEVEMNNFLQTQAQLLSGTHYALSKQRGLSGDFIQLMFTDDFEKGKSGKEAKKLAEAVRKLLSPTNNLGVSDVTMKISGEGISSGMTGGTIAAVVCGIILVIVVFITAGYCLVNKKGSMNFKVELPTPFWKSKTSGEDNPLYDMSSNDGSNDGQEGATNGQNKDSSTTVSHQLTKDTGLPQAIQSDFGVSFPNPMYHEEDL